MKSQQPPCPTDAQRERGAPRGAPTALPNSPRLSVVIPVHNDSVNLRRCLAALADSSVGDFEVIVADDASTDKTPDVARAAGARVVRLSGRSGSGAARNAGAATARGPILLFIDSDVLVHRDTLAIALATFDDDPSVDAVFGSYDLEPDERSLLSQYKNLAHRYYHQASRERASTFWTGCGAIRSEVFRAAGGFDEHLFERPAIEDIELGVRLNRAGRHIRINRRLQVKHLKRWTLPGIVKSDIFDRAIPWTRLILRMRDMPDDLNLAGSQRLGALFAGVFVLAFAAACWSLPWLVLVPPAAFSAIALADGWTARRAVTPPLRILAAVTVLAALAVIVGYAHWWAGVIALPLLGVVLVNARFYRFFVSHRGVMFAGAAVLPMHVLYYLYSGAVFTLCSAAHALRPTDTAARYRLYVVVAALLCGASWSLVLLRAHLGDTSVDFAVGDAVGYYAYLPSLVIDGDLQFRNQLETQWGGNLPEGFQPVEGGDGWAVADAKNRWPIGVALSILPGFLLAHGLSWAVHALSGVNALAPNGYTILYMLLCSANAMAIATAAFICADRLLVQRFNVSGPAAAAAVLTFWLGTHYIWPFVREPLTAHPLGASWVIFAVYLIHRIDVETRDGAGALAWWRLPLLALVTSMALTCRYTNAFIFPLFVYLLVILVCRRRLADVLRQAPLILVALAPLVAQALLLHRMYGQVVQTSVQELGYRSPEQFHWTDPALLLSLFSSRRGLFVWTPVLLFAAWGLIGHLLKRRERRRDPLLACFILSAMILWYVNASWYAWWFGNGLGNRGYLELAGLFIIGFGLAYTWLAQTTVWRRRSVLALILLAVGVNWALVGLKLTTDRLDGHDPLLPWEKRVLTGRWERF